MEGSEGERRIQNLGKMKSERQRLGNKMQNRDEWG